MSEHDDTLLDEDLGDEEYDLGNDEEEALLADDYELERQNSYKGEEETDDVLDLGVTDALDDLDGEDENIDFSRSNTNRSNDNDFYEDGDQLEDQSKYYEQDEINEYKSEQMCQQDDRSAGDSVSTSTNIGKGDLREKLQKNAAKIYAGTGQGMEDDECEEAKERRNRFQNERTIVSPKMNSNIPDTLENVLTSEPSKLICRGRGRGRSTRGNRGGRFNTQNSGNFNPRFNNARNVNFDNQPPVCRPPLLEARPPFLLGVPNNIQNQQIIYQQPNSQVQPFQHYSPNGSLQGPTHFVNSRPQFNPNQFQGQVGPRIIGPRLDYRPRASLSGSLQGPPYNHPANQPPYAQIQPGPFQNSGVLMQDNQTRLIQNNQGPLLQGNPGGSLLGNLNPLVPGTSASLLQRNQTLPMQGFPRQPSQGPPINHPNVQISNQSPFENRPSFQEAQFENRPVYDSRSGYSDQVPTSQFNINTLPVPQQSAPNVPNVPLPPGHKILINPHFRGAVQSTNDAARLAWDSAQQQTSLSSQIPNSQFSQPASSYQNQNPYGQTQQGPQPQYQQNYQQNKSDDPYAYFSDVWQENKPQKSQSGTLTKQYSVESSYSRDSNYEGGSKYKSGQWDQKDNYQEEHRGVHQNYRDRDLSSKTRTDHVAKSRPPPSNLYRDSYDQNHAQKSPGNRPMNTSVRARLPQKRVSDPVERPLRDLSPKRMKPSNRNLQEVRTVDTLNTTNNEKKDEDSDPEMQEYRKKMEEQKRLREKILREKENRRKMAAMEKQNEEAKNESNISSESTQDTKPVSVLMGVVRDASMNKDHISVGRGRGRPVSTQATEAAEKPCVRIVRTIQTVQSNDSVDPTKDNNAGHATGQVNDNTKILNAQSGTRRVVIQKSLLSTQKIATTIQKTVSNLQKGQLVGQNKATNPVQCITQKGGLSQSDPLSKSVTIGQNIGINPQRIVKQKSPVCLQKTVINVQEVTNPNAQKVISTQSNQRVVLQKAGTQQKKLPEIKTNIVKVDNLAASTSETQIRRMCQGIGTIESIQMGERSATIVFKTQSAAMVFHKKYQRKMIDLSLITVRLVPQSSGTKTTTTVVKVSSEIH
ncbi:PREDICTED: RNA-binding protein 33-like isoform X1 [Dufourea novaeangliae]|uniref:RNA-binding protein 33-like isoform X1 n=1 Tax=Dufourea novaeangliae TaxID=178035 RepID=UPI0007674366|nr:PREDICTED: RNA-binding protein 33-like isoform X1 [Dufourea novaeangliae]